MTGEVKTIKMCDLDQATIELGVRPNQTDRRVLIILTLTDQDGVRRKLAYSLEDASALTLMLHEVCREGLEYQGDLDSSWSAALVREGE